MASGVYDHGHNEFVRGNVQWQSGGDTFKIQLIDTANYTVDLAADQNLDDIPVAARIGSPETLANPVVQPAGANVGAIDADDIVDGFSDVQAADPDVDAAVIYKDTGTESTSTLLVYLDNMPEVPLDVDGTVIDFTFDSGANRIAVI